MKFTAVKGMNDIGEPEIHLWHKIEATARRLYENFGFVELRTPLLESTQLFKRGVGETTDIVEKEMYSFEDRGGEWLSLRPEGTASAVRAVLEHNWLREHPVLKAYYFGPMFRRERPQKGRYRQHFQFGLELLGCEGPQADVEIISVQAALFRSLGLAAVELHLCSIGCPQCRPQYREVLLKAVRPVAEKLCADCQRRLERNPLRIFDCKVETCRQLTADLPHQMNHLCQGCEDHLAGVEKGLSELNISYQLNPRIVRGLDYYNRTSFEFISQQIGAQGTICGGGRYDSLVQQLGGPATPAVGCGMGVERLVLLLQDQITASWPRPDGYWVTADEKSFAWGRELVYAMRQQGLRVERDLQPRSLKAQMKRANKVQAKVCIIVGESEIGKGQATIKNMTTGAETAVAFSELIAYLGQI